MADDFDPYYTWLGISAKDQPANHYRLLGIELFEANPSVIDNAADRQTGHLRSFQTGARGTVCQRLLNEVAAARVCLLSPQKKSAYDLGLSRLLSVPLAEPIAEEMDIETARGVPARAILNPPPAPQGADFLDSLNETSYSRPKASTARSTNGVRGRPAKVRWWMVLVPVVAVSSVVIVWFATRSTDEPERPLRNVAAVVANPPPAKTPPAQAPPVQTPPVQSSPPVQDCALVFDWPSSDRQSISLTVDGEPVAAPASGLWQFHCKPGEHRVNAQRAGFHSLDTLVTLTAGERRIISETFQPKATMALDWALGDREGSELKIDGDLIPASESQPMELPVEPGRHSVRITKEGKVSYDIQVLVPSGQRKLMRVPHIPDGKGLLVIYWPREERDDAQLTIDGRIKRFTTGTDSMGFIVAPGEHSIRCTRPGFATLEKTLVVNAGWPPTQCKTNFSALQASGNGDQPTVQGDGIAGNPLPGGDPATGAPVAPPAGPGAPTYGPWVDILKRADPNRNRVAGSWSRNDAEISCEAGPKSRLEIPVNVRGGYEFEVEFTRTSGNNVCIVFPIGSGQCDVVLGGPVSGLETIDGLRYDDPHNKYSIRPASIQNNQSHTILFRVRTLNDGDARLDVMLDGAPYFAHWIGKQDSVSVATPWSISPATRPALGADRSAVVFHSAKIRVSTHKAPSDSANPADKR